MEIPNTFASGQLQTCPLDKCQLEIFYCSRLILKTINRGFKLHVQERAFDTGKSLQQQNIDNKIVFTFGRM